jgi:DNA-3-methyladenine glycosylase
VPDPLPRSFYERDVVQVARDLLGKRLVRLAGNELTAGRIVEVEAYLAHDDPANHAYRGQTRRNASMFGPPGHAYVYAIHARFCLNVVTEPAGVPSAVLLRAVEPLEGLKLMQERRGTTDRLNLARGPARLCEAFAIDRTLDGWDLTRAERLWIAAKTAESEPIEIITTTRVGVTSAKNLPLRFFVAGSPFVSRSGRR